VNRRIAVVLLLAALVAVFAGFWIIRRGTPRNTVPPAASGGRIADIAARAEARPPVIFIGLDGADWALLDQYAERGVMPVLRGLVAEGASGTLQTIHPALSPLIWNTMLTGVMPLDHRVLDFLRVNPVSGQREPITSDERKAPAVWNMATNAGKRVAALGFWATYPAEAVNGLLVSDRLFTFLYSESEPPPGVVNPHDEDAWARETLKRVEQEVNYAELRQFLPSLTEDEYRTAVAAKDPYGHPVGALRRVLVETYVYDRLARDYFARAKPDLTAVYIQGTDTVGHVFAPYAPPRQPSIAPADFDRYSGVAERYFARVDRMLGEYRKLAESAGAVLVLGSDHGFKWAEGRPETLSSVGNATAAKWHTDNGVYLIWGGGTTPGGGHTGSGGVAQITSTLLALAGIPAAANVAGPPLPGAPAAIAPPVDYRPHYTPATVVAATESAARSKVDQETVDKLRALGYIGAAGGGGQAIGTRTGGSFNNEALLLKAQGRTAEAIEAFESALTVDPNLASALWNLSDLLFAERKSLDKSDTLLVRAYANGLPEGRRYLIGRAIGYQRDGRVDRSLKLLTDAATAKADDAEVWLFRGRYRVETGDCVGAVTDFERAVHLDAANAAAYASLGLGQMCAGDRTAAHESFKRSLSLNPDQPKLREMLRER
jgi:tetratricopeptide (TPR) repeat protein